MSEKTFEFTTAESAASGFMFVLDPDENNNRSVFYPGFTARLKLYPGGRNPDISASLGKASLYARKISQSVVEFLVFKNSRKITADFPVEKVISAVWTGQGKGSPSFSGKTVTLPSEVTGVMKLEYVTTYDLVDVTCPESSYVLVSAGTEELSGSYVLDFTDLYSTGLFSRIVILTVKDACTKNTISGAHVYLNGKYSGMSDSEGRVRLGSMKTGTYSLLVTKDGYKDTDKDNVCNDYFTVS